MSLFRTLEPQGSAKHGRMPLPAEVAVVGSEINLEATLIPERKSRRAVPPTQSPTANAAK
jgi:hypothetical protein